MSQGGGKRSEDVQLPTVKPEWNYGNIITLGVIVIGAIAGYVKLQERAEASVVFMSRLESKDESLQKQIDALRESLSAQQVLVTGKLSRIEALVERIDKRASP